MAKNEGGSQNWNSRFVPPIPSLAPNYLVTLFLGPPLRRRLELACVHAGVTSEVQVSAEVLISSQGAQTNPRTHWLPDSRSLQVPW